VKGLIRWNFLLLFLVAVVPFPDERGERVRRGDPSVVLDAAPVLT